MKLQNATPATFLIRTTAAIKTSVLRAATIVRLLALIVKTTTVVGHAHVLITTRVMDEHALRRFQWVSSFHNQI